MIALIAAALAGTTANGPRPAAEVDDQLASLREAAVLCIGTKAESMTIEVQADGTITDVRTRGPGCLRRLASKLTFAPGADASTVFRVEIDATRGLGSNGTGTPDIYTRRSQPKQPVGLVDTGIAFDPTTSQEPVLLGSTDRADVKRVVSRNLNQIKYCYQRELTKDPNLMGDVVIKFTIAKDGTVSTASTKSTTLNNNAVESCVIGRFMRMQFPPVPGGGITIVSYPFSFTPY